MLSVGVKRPDGDVPFVTFLGFRILLGSLLFTLSHPTPFFTFFPFFLCPARALHRASWLVRWYARELVFGVRDKTDYWFTSHDRPDGTRPIFQCWNQNYATKNRQEKMLSYLQNHSVLVWNPAPVWSLDVTLKRNSFWLIKASSQVLIYFQNDCWRAIKKVFLQF